jgi:hypothetical protein
MEMLVSRGQSGNLSIPGELSIDGAHACWTLENKADAIPAGRYKVILYNSPRLGRVVPLLNDVPGRSMIEMHWGNFASNYEGCIGLGETRDTSTEEIFYTREAFDSVFPQIASAVALGDCWITVQDPSL